MKAHLLEYKYEYYCQGVESDIGYALVYIRDGASFTELGDKLIENRHNNFDHKILPETIIDLTIE